MATSSTSWYALARAGDRSDAIGVSSIPAAPSRDSSTGRYRDEQSEVKNAVNYGAFEDRAAEAADGVICGHPCDHP